MKNNIMSEYVIPRKSECPMQIIIENLQYCSQIIGVIKINSDNFKSGKISKEEFIENLEKLEYEKIQKSLY